MENDASQPSATRAPEGDQARNVDFVAIDEAFLDIPDSENEAIFDAKMTYLVTLITAVAFIVIVIFYIL